MKWSRNKKWVYREKNRHFFESLKKRGIKRYIQEGYTTKEHINSLIYPCDFCYINESTVWNPPFRTICQDCADAYGINQSSVSIEEEYK